MTIRRFLMRACVFLGVAAGGSALSGCEDAANAVGPARTSARVTTQPTPAATAPQATAALLSGNVQGQIKLPGGKATAAGIAIHVYPLDPGAPDTVFRQGVGLISNSAGALISNSAGALVSNGAGMRRTLGVEDAPGAVTYTDAQGRFQLDVPATVRINVEAVASADLKVLLRDIGAASASLNLELAPVGTLEGVVTTTATGVTDLLDAEVFLPGTSYIARVGQGGVFRIPGLPVGKHPVVVIHPVLGRGGATVDIVSGKTAKLANLQIVTQPPVIRSLSSQVGAPGLRMRLVGDHLGIASGKLPEVYLGGLRAEAAVIDEDELSFVVPAAARSGPLVVSVGGLASAPTNLPVLASLALEARDSTVHAGPVFEDTVSLGVRRRYVVVARDTEGQARELADVPWSSTQPDVATVGPDGVVVAKAPGLAWIQVRLGDLTLPLPLGLQVVEAVAGLEISRDPLGWLHTRAPDEELVGLPVMATLLATHRMQDGSARELPVHWWSDDPRVRVVDDRLEVLADQASGDVWVYGASLADPARVASLSIPIERLGGLEVGIR
ncbi:MAG: hypothetical protein FJY99_07540 [Candidatus Sericytochromatia bacterium]|nr:hypothetical protein [Candidatus Tanganyikabacteria bacterium]